VANTRGVAKCYSRCSAAMLEAVEVLSGLACEKLSYILFYFRSYVM
jgi:hypothetical protein